jgi:hypothetical protein
LLVTLLVALVPAQARLRAAPVAGAAVAGTAATSAVLQPGKGGFVAVPPFRLVDTRQAVAAGQYPLYGAPAFLAGESDTFQLFAPTDPALPAGGIGAAVLNVTVTNPTGDGYITIWPAGEARPATSVLNFRAGQTVANAVSVKVSADLKVSFFTSGGTDLLVDVTGVYAGTGGTPGGGGFEGVVPTRLLDTRLAGQPVAATISPDGTTAAIHGLDVSPVVPASAVAVVLNVTAVPRQNGPLGGYVTVYPSGGGAPLASNLNHDGRHVVANQVTVKLAAGKVDLFMQTPVDVVVDVMGYYASGSLVPGGFVPLSPSRFMDTRNPSVSALWFYDPGTGTYVVDATGVTTVAGETIDLAAAAGSFNVTATNPGGGGYVTVWPDGGARPGSSSLNYGAGQTVPNAVTVGLGESGGIELFTLAKADLIVDMNGWFSSPFV